MEGKLFSIVLKSNNEKLNKAYQKYLESKNELQKALYEEGIVVEVNKDANSGN